MRSKVQDSATSVFRAKMKALHRAAEPDVLAPLIEAARTDSRERDGIVANALGLLADLRVAQRSGWVNQFLQQYRLNSSEGVALLSLAEAFLRVPDPETADLLISDKLGDADWRAHTGKSSSALVNSATWGLVIGRALVADEGNAGVLRRLISRAQMLETLGGTAGESFDRAMDVRISRLRTKLGEDPKNPRLIKTIYGAGYIFLAELG